MFWQCERWEEQYFAKLQYQCNVLVPVSDPIAYLLTTGRNTSRDQGYYVSPDPSNPSHESVLTPAQRGIRTTRGNVN